ncbi:hypothetical protein TVAG_256890 [Trichomonas vaginalis G3]|uniref:VPS9 domain-containing protein n=1 Tax=Trichomonas vaginalis (strain ATCC PRA-98 / G3) TaxID=412133 RepID=A2FEZ5_TRIV3|nr:VPS9 domain family [Trichomonas vaginalis G3]EAX96549.1 hypothetical protein TVAG_256890 [Trichomonas vaginalis G3]KAI5541083.1 VPS9 domain family [Trichomonas vaginalis G3]|eukprot:XP_001309479.1 hypothetical protein [Trichomonas vaginalis G3]
MSTSPDSLLTLKQLLHREQAFFDIEWQKIKSFQKDSYDSIKKLIFLTRKVYSLHLSIVEQMKTGAVIPVPDLITLSKNFPSGFTATQQRAYQNAIATVKDPKQIQNTVDGISKFLTEHPESENYIVFSFIPALFSCFWSDYEIESYIEFFKTFDPKFYPILTKSILVHQSFYVFLDSVRIDAEIILQEQRPLRDLIGLFSNRSFLFPISLRQILNDVKDAKEFFVKSILEPVLLNPSLYGLLPCIETKTFEYMVPQIEECSEIIDSLITDIATAKNYVRTQPNEEKLKTVLMKNEKLIYLLKDDCRIITSILNRDIEIPTTDDVFQIPYQREKNFENDENDEKSDTEEQNDPFESLIRSLIISLDVSKPRGSFLETLEYAVALRTGPTRLQCELQLDELRQMMEMNKASNDVNYYINLLKEKYDQRMAHRQQTLSGKINTDSFKILFTQSQQCIEYLNQKKDNLILLEWDKTEHLFDQLNIPELNQKPAAFLESFEFLINSFKTFVDKNKIVITQERFLPLLYTRLTKCISLQTFNEFHPNYVEMDKKISDMITNHKDELISMNSQKWLERFQNDPTLLGLAQDCLRRASEETTSVSIMVWIDKALNSLQFLLSFYGFKEIGADVLVPASIFLFILVNPSKTSSMAAYLEHTILCDEMGLIPITPSMQYYATLVNSVAKWFREKVEELKL